MGAKKTMRKLLLNKCAAICILTAVCCFSQASAQAAEGNLKVGVVNFKECVDKSKIGKQEQSSFEALKKQAENVIQEKEKTLREISNKINDADYMDSLSNEAEAELKHRFRALSQELGQQQQQLYQTLSQANYKIIQKLTDEVNEAAKKVAAAENFDLVLNEDSCFFFSPKLDVTTQIIKALDDKVAKSN